MALWLALHLCLIKREVTFSLPSLVLSYLLQVVYYKKAAFASLTLFSQAFVTKVYAVGEVTYFLATLTFLFHLFLTWTCFLPLFSVSLEPKKIFLCDLLFFFFKKMQLFRTYVLLMQLGSTSFFYVSLLKSVFVTFVYWQ